MTPSSVYTRYLIPNLPPCVLYQFMVFEKFGIRNRIEIHFILNIVSGMQSFRILNSTVSLLNYFHFINILHII